ncbi:MAG: hypothetical protein KatS3mg111_3278 [Pirellulaceae bacterium]|nr:MAG: hypothetical protein KatS3mg111_3278 [Pirellulaceae bacterium]
MKRPPAMKQQISENGNRYSRSSRHLVCSPDSRAIFCLTAIRTRGQSVERFLVSNGGTKCRRVGRGGSSDDLGGVMDEIVESQS